MPIIISFLFGVLSNMLNCEPYCQENIQNVAVWAFSLSVFDLAGNILISAMKGETRFHIRVLKEMTFEQYQLLMNDVKRKNCLCEELDKTKAIKP